jgi:hypothetical protein
MDEKYFHLLHCAGMAGMVLQNQPPVQHYESKIITSLRRTEQTTFFVSTAEQAGGTQSTSNAGVDQKNF